MVTRRWTFALAIVGVILTMIAGLVLTQLPVIGAGGLLHPARTRVVRAAPATCRDAAFAGAGVTLRGWRCSANGVRRGTIVYLHGTADNRTSSAGVIRRFGPRGFDVIAYDSRGHGESGGAICTYGFFEKHDLHGVLDTIGSGPIVLLGTSLGGAVALQEAVDDRRVTAVIAAETFTYLRTIAAERAPFFFTKGTIRRAFQVAAEQGHFDVDAVSPERAAADITVPVLLVHGAMDIDTRPEHSQRVFAALRGPKRLILVPNAAHNGSLRPAVWLEIERWLDEVLGRMILPG
jgi:pimeloyl-ACP methyl ester carboxylesterase